MGAAARSFGSDGQIFGDGKCLASLEIYARDTSGFGFDDEEMAVSIEGQAFRPLQIVGDQHGLTVRHRLR